MPNKYFNVTAEFEKAQNDKATAIRSFSNTELTQELVKLRKKGNWIQERFFLLQQKLKTAASKQMALYDLRDDMRDILEQINAGKVTISIEKSSGFLVAHQVCKKFNKLKFIKDASVRYITHLEFTISLYQFRDFLESEIKQLKIS